MQIEVNIYSVDVGCSPTNDGLSMLVMQAPGSVYLYFVVVVDFHARKFPYCRLAAIAVEELEVWNSLSKTVLNKCSFIE